MGARDGLGRLDGEFAGRRPAGRVPGWRGGRDDRAIGGDRHDRGDPLLPGDRAGDRRKHQCAAQGRPDHAQLRRLARVAEHGPGWYATGIAPGELLAVALRGRGHLSLQLGAVHQRGYLEAKCERLDQHHGGERDENVGRGQPGRQPPCPAPHPVQHPCTLSARRPPAYPSKEGPALPPPREAPAAAGRDAGRHAPTVSQPSREQTPDEQLPRPPTARAGASRSRHNRHSYRPAGRGMQQRQPVIRRGRRLTAGGRLSEFVVRARLLPVRTRPRGAGLPRPRQQRAAFEASCRQRVARGQQFPGRGGHGSLCEAEPRRAGKPRSHGPTSSRIT